MAERFWEKVDRGGDGCWEWQGQRSRWGYGYFVFKGRRRHAHRISWELANGDPPGNLFVCHTCDNPPCVRPDHLFLGTALDNNRDRAAKGRTALNPFPGEDNGRAVLTEVDVREARARHARTGESFATIAREYRVSEAAMRFAIRGITWKHLT